MMINKKLKIIQEVWNQLQRTWPQKFNPAHERVKQKLMAK